MYSMKSSEESYSEQQGFGCLAALFKVVLVVVVSVVFLLGFLFGVLMVYAMS